MLAHWDIARTGWALVRSGLGYHRGGDKHQAEEFYFCYFEFLKKLAERLGFIRQSLSQGYLYL